MKTTFELSSNSCENHVKPLPVGEGNVGMKTDESEFHKIGNVENGMQSEAVKSEDDNICEKQPENETNIAKNSVNNPDNPDNDCTSTNQKSNIEDTHDSDKISNELCYETKTQQNCSSLLPNENSEKAHNDCITRKESEDENSCTEKAEETNDDLTHRSLETTTEKTNHNLKNQGSESTTDKIHPLHDEKLDDAADGDLLGTDSVVIEANNTKTEHNLGNEGACDHIQSYYVLLQHHNLSNFVSLFICIPYFWFLSP